MAYDWGKGLGGAGLGLFAGMGGRSKPKKISTLDKRQQGILDQINSMINPEGQLGQGYGQSLDLLKQYMDPSSEAVNQFTQPYMDQFNQQTVPQLAERFAGMGGGMGGGLSSSGFGQALSSAGGQLQNQLAALKSQLAQQAAQQLMGQYGQAQQNILQTPTFAYQRPEAGMFPGMMNAWAKGGFAGSDKIFDFLKGIGG